MHVDLDTTDGPGFPPWPGEGDPPVNETTELPLAAAKITRPPYAKLPLSPHEDVRIADRLVILTDGDDGEVAEGAEFPGVARKRKLDAVAAGLRSAQSAPNALWGLPQRGLGGKPEL